jgi:outer membrane protein assembly factor BamB
MSFNRCFAIILGVAVVTATSAACVWATAADWSQWRGVDRANRSDETGLFETWREDGPPIAWIAEGMGQGYASVSVESGRVYTTGNRNGRQVVVAVDADDGTVLWESPISDSVPPHEYPGSRGVPTIDGERVYAVSSDGAIHCLSSVGGAKLWSRDFDEWQGALMSRWGFSESPLVDGDWVICTPGGESAMVVALDKWTGKTVWQCEMPPVGDAKNSHGKELKRGAGYSSAIISHGGGVKQYVQFVGRGLIGISAGDGRFLWQYTRAANGTANIPTAIVDGDYLFNTSGYDTGAALLKLSGDGSGGVTVQEIYWLDSKKLQCRQGGLVLADGYVYGGHGNGLGLPICVEMATGEVAWGPERAEGSGETCPIYADGHIVYRREDGTVILAEATPEQFRPVASFVPPVQDGKSWAHPVIAGGMLYLREQDKLMAYRLKP